jgi:predicted dehydrogenase
MQENGFKILLLGLGRIGKNHAAAYQSMDACSLVAICGREHQRAYAAENYPQAEFYLDGDEAIATVRPDVVCVATHVDSHEQYARAAISNDAHVFLEKPATETLKKTAALFQFAQERHKKILVGYVRRHDALWQAFVTTSSSLGSPLVMRFSMDQPSVGDEWGIHKSILKRSSLVFDCAVHFVDMMSKISGAQAVSVMARSTSLHKEAKTNANYGFLSVEFSDGSVGSYESLWGPMASAANEATVTAAGPNGSVSIVSVEDDNNYRKDAVILEQSQEGIREGQARRVIDLAQQEDAFVMQQHYLFDCIHDDRNMDEHYKDVIDSMQIVVAADESAATGETVRIGAAP